MRKATYITWGVWLLGGITLKILGLVSWWVALSAIWLPVAGVVSAGVFIFVTADIGAYLKMRKNDRIPPECGNCLFGTTCDIINESRMEGEEKVKCIGEKMTGNPRGTVCPYYERAK